MTITTTEAAAETAVAIAEQPENLPGEGSQAGRPAL